MPYSGTEEERKQKSQDYYLKNRDKILKKNKDDYNKIINNPDLKDHFYKKRNEYAKHIYIKYVDRYRKIKNDYKKEKYKENPEEVKRVWRETENSYYKKNPSRKLKKIIRSLTVRKFGKAPPGFNYHHIGDEYKKDNFILLPISEHHSLRRKY